jgi:hypothetical protein
VRGRRGGAKFRAVRWPLIPALALLVLVGARAEAAPETPPGWFPAGTWTVSGGLGVGDGSVAVGAGAGYAALDGVLIGARGLVAPGTGAFGELALTLDGFLPLAAAFAPYARLEAGRRFDAEGAWLYGAGAGLGLGASSRAALLLGYMVRWLAYADGTVMTSGPSLAVLLRF